jgi:hypothetical protein
MARWVKGEQTVQFLIDWTRLESFEAEDLAGLTDALIGRAMLRVETTATAALAGGDVDGAFVAAYDAYRMSAEVLQFGTDIPAFTKPMFERLRRARHSA